MALIHGATKKNVPFSHAIMDKDAFISGLVQYWAVNQIYVADLAFKRKQMAELGKQLADD